MKSETKRTMGLALCLAAGIAAADNFYAKNGITDWATADSFTMDVAGETAATRAPGGEALVDTVFIPTHPPDEPDCHPCRHGA